MSDAPAKKTALVIGATGVSGRALITHLERQPDWDVVGVSRKKPYFDTRARFISVDLMDAASCRDGFAAAADVTHVFYTAYADDPDVAKTRVPNTRMFTNALAAIDAHAKHLQHVSLVQG